MLCFQSVHTPGGVPHLHLHPIILPLVPCYFQGVPHPHPIILSLVPCPFWGYPTDWSQVRDSPSLGWGPPWPGQDGILPPARTAEGIYNWYAAIVMPLTFTQEDFLVLLIMIKIHHSSILNSLAITIQVHPSPVTLSVRVATTTILVTNVSSPSPTITRFITHV